ncbi:MAG: hypothetical protein HY842_01670 [Bacteroidetes bacterium]|nr:hypothetical protein [Bacteroidota bacterium]
MKPKKNSSAETPPNGLITSNWCNDAPFDGDLAPFFVKIYPASPPAISSSPTFADYSVGSFQSGS